MEYIYYTHQLYITCTYFLNENPIFVVFINFIVFGGVAFFLTHLIKKVGFHL